MFDFAIDVAIEKKDLSIVKYLLGYGFDITYAHTVLIQAARRSDKEALESFLALSDDIVKHWYHQGLPMGCCRRRSSIH